MFCLTVILDENMRYETRIFSKNLLPHCFSLILFVMGYDSSLLLDSKIPPAWQAKMPVLTAAIILYFFLHLSPNLTLFFITRFHALSGRALPEAASFMSWATAFIWTKGIICSLCLAIFIVPVS